MGRLTSVLLLRPYFSVSSYFWHLSVSELWLSGFVKWCPVAGLATIQDTLLLGGLCEFCVQVDY